MPTNLTSNPPQTTYNQLLHVDGGVDSTSKSVYGGTGTLTAFKISTAGAGVDNIWMDGNTLSTLDTNGNLTLAPNGTGYVGIANVNITGGAVTGITDLAVADGGTGASTASGARTNLGLGTIATQDASNVTITGGTISGSYTSFTTLGAATIRATSAIGYGTGAGSTVTQATNKSTGVTINARTGQITMNNASLASATTVSFTVTNSTIVSTDVIIVNIGSAATAGSYTVTVDAVANGSFRVSLRNETGGALGEALVLNFAVITGVTS